MHGMPGWCTLCSGTQFPRPEGHPFARPDDEPRFAKGRDSAKWIGLGESFKMDSHAGMRAAAAEGSARMPRSPHSWWSQALDAAYERRAVVNPHERGALTPAQVLDLVRVRTLTP